MFQELEEFSVNVVGGFKLYFQELGGMSGRVNEVKEGGVGTKTGES